MSTTDILIGGGRVFFNDGGQDGLPGNGYLDMGNIPALAIQKAITEIEHFGFNAVTKSRQKDLNIVTDIGMSLSFTVDELFAEMWNILLFGNGTTTQTQTASTATAETGHIAPALLNRSIFADNTNITAGTLVVKDDGGVATFVLGTDYEIVNLVTGEIKILSGGTVEASEPLELTYDYTGRVREKIVPGADASVKGAARLEFTAQNGDDFTWIIQNCEVKPDGDSPLSSTEASEVSVILNILVDKVVNTAEPFGEVLQG
ncbi:MAG: hypothetical protein KAR42_18005 [candidate division Zixibacteria bacterium]|nr:hypothetical protein [candidate division Zixibacteria bacterium]